MKSHGFSSQTHSKKTFDLSQYNGIISKNDLSLPDIQNMSTSRQRLHQFVDMIPYTPTEVHRLNDKTLKEFNVKKEEF